MKKGKKEKAKTPVAPVAAADSKKMLMLQKKLGKIGKWNLNATINVN